MNSAHRSQLTPLLSARVRGLLEDVGFLQELVEANGSPLNIVLPQALAGNAQALESVLVKHQVGSRILYACKVNQSESLVEAAADAGIGIDASSLWEVRRALGHGVPGDRIGISGPIKSGRLLLLAAAHGCTISIDSVGELQTLTEVISSVASRRPVPVLARLAGFSTMTIGRSEPASHSREDDSRFGITPNEILELLELLRATSPGAIELRGFAFHLDSMTVDDRVTALERTLGMILAGREEGHPCTDINIGGGIPTRYVSPEDWTAFHRRYSTSLARGEDIMFGAHDFGVLLSGEGVALNRGNFYPHDAPYCGPNFLDAVLSRALPSGVGTVASALRHLGLRMTIEPGRALTDQTGLTLCRVLGTRHSSSGKNSVVCDMNVTHLHEQLIGSEFAVDPILLGDEGAAGGSPRFVGHVAGNLCMESDILTRRPVQFGRIPVAGDLLAFSNTAGYQMDFVEARTHSMPVPRKLAFFWRDGERRWCQDSEYSALLSR